MEKSSEAREYPGTTPIPEEKVVKPELRVLEGGPLEGGIVEEIKEEKIDKISSKVEKKIAKKVAACIAAGIVGTTGGFIAFGETGNLPEEIQKWYDSTSESIRKAFGIAVVEGITDVQPEAPFAGLEIEGLETVFQNGRWEYIDSNDGLVAGYWSEKEGRYEHTASVLKGEWAGLFINQSLEKTRSQLAEDENWSVENWNEGKIKVPVPFDITKGGVIEEIKALGNFIRGSKTGKVLGIRDLPTGAVIFSPLPFEETGASYAWSGNSANVDIDKDSIFLSFNFKNTSQCLLPDNPFPDNPYKEGSEYSTKFDPLVLGYPFLEVNKNDILPKVATAVVNPFLKENYQVLISSNQERKGPISFSFENLLRDDKGRFIFINPSSTEVEEMKNTIEEEVNNATLEAEKKETEEKLEASSIIDQEKTTPTIQGLEFEKESGFYFARENNEYGLMEGEKAGAFVDGFLSLKPGVIRALQTKTKRYSFPIPINPAEGKIRIAEVVDRMSGGSMIIVIDLSEKTTIYSPKGGSFYQHWGRKITDFGGEKWENYEGLGFELQNKMGEIRGLDIRSKKFEFLTENGEVDVGMPLAKTDNDITYELYLGGSPVDIMNYILKIDNIPVFILPNE